MIGYVVYILENAEVNKADLLSDIGKQIAIKLSFLIEKLTK